MKESVIDAEFSETPEGCKGDQILELDHELQSKYLKKYGACAGLLAVGVFMGNGVITLGIFGGALAGLGTKLAMDRLKESKPSMYNWVLDHPGWVEVGSMILGAGIFGLTLGGVFTSLVANLTTTVVLDYYAEIEGKVQGVDTLTFRGVLKSIVVGIREFISNFKKDVKSIIKEIKTSQVNPVGVVPTPAGDVSTLPLLSAA